MRKTLLASASALALGLFATSAMAGSDNYWNQNYGKNSTENTAVAVGVQINSVENDGSIRIGSQGGSSSESSSESTTGKWGYGSSSSSSESESSLTNMGVVNNVNSIDGSFNSSTGLINVNQNNGNNVSQDAQNTVAAIINCDCSSGVGHGKNADGSDNTAVAVGLQASYVSNGYGGDIVVDVANQGNSVHSSFNGSTGLINVNQNNGNNVSQKAQNTVAAIIGKSSTTPPKP